MRPRPAFRFIDSLLFRLLMLAALPLVAVAVSGLVAYRTSIAPIVREQIITDLTSRNLTHAGMADEWFTEQQGMVRYIAARPEYTAWNTPEMLREARLITAALPRVNTVVAADPVGQVVVDSIRDVGGSVSERDYFQGAIAGVSTVSDIIKARTSGNLFIIFAEPVTAPSGGTIGVVFVPVRPTTLRAALHSSIDTPTMSSYVVDSQGRIAAGAEPGRLIEAGFPLPAHPAARYVNFEGVDVYGVRTPLANVNWTVVSEIPVTSVSAAFQRYNHVLIATIGIALVIAFVTAFLVAASILSPVTHLDGMALRIGSGEYSAVAPEQFPPHAPLELRRLNTNLAAMAQLIYDRTTQLQNTNALLATTQEIAHLGSWELVPQTGTIRCSAEVYRIIGVPTTTGSITVKRALRAIGTADSRLFLRMFLESVRTGAPGFEMIHRLIRADTGADRWVLQRCIHRRDPDGHVVWTRGMVHDITDRHRIEESLRLALAEKSVLLQEVNHRVRNNLAVVQSMLSLQRDHLPPESRAYGALTDAGSRVASMSIIHDQLYNADNAASIILGEYVATLLSRIQESYAVPGIDLQSESDDLTIDVTRAISCGLIVNELVVNAYKHAFPTGSGTISVAVRRSGQDIEIVVTDDGTGQEVPPAPNDERPTTGGLGRELVTQLAAQIDGTVTYRSERGTRVVVRFPADEPVPV